MELYKQELIKILRLEVFNHVIIITLVFIAIIVCYILKNDKTYKVLLFVSVLFLFIMIILSINTFIPLYKDITNNAFVKMENVSFSSAISKFDSSGFQEILIYDENNNPVVLKTTKHFEEEIFNGIIVYAKESKYLVFCQSGTYQSGDG